MTDHPEPPTPAPASDNRLSDQPISAVNGGDDQPKSAVNGRAASPTPDATPPDTTVTAPAGEKPPMRVPKHGQGRIYTAGVKGNKGGGRLPAVVLDKLVLIGDQTCDELLARLADEKVRAKMSMDALRLVLGEVLPYFLARKFEHTGADGGPIALEVDAVRLATAESLRARMERLRVLRAPAPAAPAALPIGSIHAGL